MDIWHELMTLGKGKKAKSFRWKEDLALECKYVGDDRIDPFRANAWKVRMLSRKAECRESQFYLAEMHEGARSADHLSALTPRQSSTWAQGRLTELVACWGEDGYAGGAHFEVLPYNGLNPGIHYMPV